jgi:hypothetical protein
MMNENQSLLKHACFMFYHEVWNIHTCNYNKFHITPLFGTGITTPLMTLAPWLILMSQDDTGGYGNMHTFIDISCTFDAPQ